MDDLGLSSESPNEELEKVANNANVLEPWLRAYGEPVRNWRAFVAYRDLGPQRSLSRAAMVAGELERSCSNWFSAWQWAYRVEMFDRYVARQAAEATAASHADMLERHINISMLLQKLAVTRLSKTDPGELTMLDVVRFFRESVKIERLARGVPTEITQRNSGDEPKEESDIGRQWYGDILSVLAESGALPDGFDESTIASIIDAEAHEVHTSHSDSETSSVPADPP